MCKNMLEILKAEIKPATGCTGPTAYALATARSKPYITGKIKHVTIYLSPVFFKIGFGVSTPGTTDRGIKIASALGLVGGDYTLGIDVLRPCDENHMKEATNLVKEDYLSIVCDREKTGLYVRAEIETLNEKIEVTLAGRHDNIISVKVNGKEMLESATLLEDSELFYDSLNFDDIYKFVINANLSDIEFLDEGFKINFELAEDGLKNRYGLESGINYLRSLLGNELPEDINLSPLKYLPNSLSEQSRILVSAASDARMGGSKLPAMTIMGDGNQGITALLPVGIAANLLGRSREQRIRALALSSLVTIYIKNQIGRSSAFCLCAIAASAGVASGISYLHGMDKKIITKAIKNVITSLAGMLCDGAKNGCALKMSVATSTAIYAVEIAKFGSEVGKYDGLADTTLEDTVKAIASIAVQSEPVLDELMTNGLLAKES